jgi:predicted dehydrogenase
LSPHLDTTEPLYTECAHFLECIQTGREPHTSPRTSVDVVRVLQAAERSLRRGGAPQLVYDVAAIERTP